VVKVLDINDNDPVFEFPIPHNHSVTISASLPIGHHVTRVVARDRDAGHNGRVIYTLPATGDNVDRKFDIQRQHGVIYLNFRFDHVTYAEYRLTVVAKDEGLKPRPATSQLVVVVNHSIPFPLPAGSRDPEVVRYNAVIVMVGVLTLAALVGVAILVMVSFTRCRDSTGDIRAVSPLSAVITSHAAPRQLSDITPCSSTVRFTLRH